MINSTSPYFETDLGSLYKGDCLRLLFEMESESVDCVFADPPFNLDKDYGKGVNDLLPEVTYLSWCSFWIRECVRVLKPGGSLFLYNLPKWNTHLAVELSKTLHFRNWISIDMKGSAFIPNRLYPSHYSLLYFCKGEKPTTFNPPRTPIEVCRHCGGERKDYGGYKKKMNPAGITLSDVWSDLSPVRHKHRKTRKANQLPLKLLDRVLDIASVEGDLVLDPFGGSGTTFVACELKGRRWIGFEMGDCDVIEERLSDLSAEEIHLAQIRGDINTLFTKDSLKLRTKKGKRTHLYQLLPDYQKYAK